MSGRWCACATSARPSRSAISPDGFAIDLDEDQLGLVGDRGGVVGRVGAECTKVVSTPKRRSVTSSWVIDAAVEARRGDDVVAGSGERGEGDELGAETGCRGDRPEAALERGDALLEAGDRRVREAAVDVAVLLQGEAGGGIRGVVEDERAGLVDRQRAGAGARHPGCCRRGWRGCGSPRRGRASRCRLRAAASVQATGALCVLRSVAGAGFRRGSPAASHPVRVGAGEGGVDEQGDAGRGSRGRRPRPSAAPASAR